MENLIEKLSPLTGKRFYSASEREIIEQAISVLEKSGKYVDFCNETRRFRDYSRRIATIITYLNAIAQTESAGTHVSAPIVRRVGRPTKQEQEQYKAFQRQKAIAEAEASLFPEIKPDTEHQRMTYNGIVANPNGESIAATMPHLQDIKWFLSPTLQARVNSVRDLRNEMASKAEQAKTMTEANERSVQSGSAALYSESEIATLATRAAEIESDILPAIFSDVDREMGEVYLRLSEKNGDPEYIVYIQKHITTPPADLRTKFKCFYEKALERDPRFAEMVAEKIANDRPEVKAKRDAEAKRKAEAAAIIKYLQRKDKPNTARRIKGMEKKLEELVQLIGEEDAKPYFRLLDLAREDYEKNTSK